MKKRALVIHSGGMDSSICLARAIKDFSKDDVLSLSFNYGQRHSSELEAAKKICLDWKIDHTIIPIGCLSKITENALTNKEIPIRHTQKEPNTLVVGRNGLMARLGAIHAGHLGADVIYMGIIEVEEANSGYRDCSRRYMDLMEEILRIDLDNPKFEIRTPLVKMTKFQTLEQADRLGVLGYLLNTTISCYEGVAKRGCKVCPACLLRNEAIDQFKTQNPTAKLRS